MYFNFGSYLVDFTSFCRWYFDSKDDAGSSGKQIEMSHTREPTDTRQIQFRKFAVGSVGVAHTILKLSAIFYSINADNCLCVGCWCKFK